MSYTFSFERLNVWQDARKFVNDVYALTANFPDSEKYGITSQLRRAAVSVVSNIAEGVGRQSLKEQARFIEISYSSLMEVYCQLLISTDQGYLSQDEFLSLKSDMYKISNELNQLRKSMERRSAD
ncbi:MAG: four helix bundle protein [Bacteroidales bacterium]